MDKKIKIAIIGSRGYPYVYSGYETLVKELSERLVKKGHNVRVYCHRSLFKKKPKYAFLGFFFGRNQLLRALLDNELSKVES